MTLSLELRRFISFLFASGAAAVVNILSRIVINRFTSYEAAIVFAYICGMTVAYVLNRLFVFDSQDRRVAAEYGRFALVNLVAAAQVWCISVALARLLFPALGFEWHAETVAHAIGVVSPAYTSYLGHKHISFGSAR